MLRLDAEKEDAEKEKDHNSKQFSTTSGPLIQIQSAVA
jgi:hypothetical protein